MNGKIRKNLQFWQREIGIRLYSRTAKRVQRDDCHMESKIGEWEKDVSMTYMVKVSVRGMAQPCLHIYAHIW